MNVHVGKPHIAAAKLQHHVIYVSDLQRSKDFYVKLFDLQFSALNHPEFERGDAPFQSANAFLQLRLLSPRSLSGEASQAEDGQQFDASLHAGGTRP